MKKAKIKDMALCSLFAASSAILSQISIPVGLVPINLTHISIFIAAGLLGANYAAASQLIFVLVGVTGVPVFSGFSGGIGVLLGYRGGFIIGYIGCAFLAGWMIDHFGKSLQTLILAMIVGMLITYVCGLSWYMFVTNTGFAEAFLVCVVPFLIGDALKIIISSMLVMRLSSLAQKYRS